MTVQPDIKASAGTKSFFVDLTQTSLQGAGRLIASLIRRVNPAAKKLQVEITSESDENIFKSIKNRYGQVSMPVLRISPESIQKTTDGLNRQVMEAHGLNIGLTQDRAHSLILHTIPNIIQANVSYYGNDYEAARQFIAALMSVESERVTFGVDISDPKFTFNIRTVFADNFSYPVPQEIENVQNIYRVDTSLGIRTYILRIERVPNMRYIEITPRITNNSNFNDVVNSIENDTALEGPDWDASQLAFTIDLREYADSLTND